MPVLWGILNFISNETGVNYPAPPDLEKGKNVNLVLGLSPFKLNDTGKAKFEIRFSEDEKTSIVHHFLIMVNKQV
jgi:hypothetical protein